MRALDSLLSALRRPSALPLRVFFAVLVLVFGIEYAVMIFLASISPPRPEGTSLDIVDSVLLTTLLAPAIWWLVVRPLQKLFDARGRLLGQQLTAIMLGLRTVQEATTIEQGRERAAAVARIGSDALDSVRAIARGLRPAVLEDLGLGPAIERLCEEFRSVHDVEVQLESEIPPDRRFAPPVEICIYRLLQESLTNAARHSGASSVRVALRLTKSAVGLWVSDDGKGFNPAAVAAGSSGLQGMKERVSMLDGELRIESEDGGGTRVIAGIPIDDRWMHAQSTPGDGEEH